MARRILVTGSRDWDDDERIRQALIEHGHRNDVLVQGGASGADSIAARYWSLFGEVETWRADWRGACGESCPPGHRKTQAGGWSYCPRAGLVRNHAMVMSQPDLCLAFIKNNSRGATHCANLAEGAGIETTRFYI